MCALSDPMGAGLGTHQMHYFRGVPPRRHAHCFSPSIPRAPHAARHPIPLPLSKYSPGAGRNLEGPSNPWGPSVTTFSPPGFLCFPLLLLILGAAGSPLPGRARLEGGLAACWRQMAGKGHSHRDPFVFPPQDWLPSSETPGKANCQPPWFLWAHGVSSGALVGSWWSWGTHFTWPCSVL